MWVIRTFLMLLLSFLFNACVTPVTTKPQGYAEGNVLTTKDIKEVPSQELLESLSRSYLHESGIYESLYIEAMLKTPVSEFQKIKKAAVANKWADDVVKEKLAKITKSFDNKVCFDVLVKTNDKAAMKPKTWKVTLKQGKKKATRKTIAGFKEQTPKSIFASAQQTFEHVQNDMQYFLETTVCFKKKTKFKNELVLKIQPKFNDEVDEVVLSWWFK